MPNRAGRNAKATAQTETAQENTVTTTENTAPAYDLDSIGDLGSYEFKRAGAGRKRVPSPFDEVVERFVGQGTKFLPVADKATGEKAVEDLQKACNWDRGRTDFRGYGLTKRLTEISGVEGMADGWYVIFEVKAEKEKRNRKPKETASADAAAPSAEAQAGAETE